MPWGGGAGIGTAREFDSFKLFTKGIGSTNFDNQIFNYTASHPYAFVNSTNNLLIDASVSPVLGSEFRAEFTASGSGGPDGPRIEELDGFGYYTAGTNKFGVANDVWDISQGTVVTGSSPAAHYRDAQIADGGPFDPAAVFGGVNPNAPGEFEDFIFSDNETAGSTNFIEWQTPNPVSVKAFRLYASGDGRRYQNQREFGNFRLLAKSPGSSTYDLVLASFTPSHPYEFVDVSKQLVLERNISPITAKEFRAEFTALSNQPYNGARITELDGFSDFLPPRGVASPAVEVSWDSISNRVYQVQYSTSLDNLTWTNFGVPIVGTGSTISVFDSARSDISRLYRILDLSSP